MNDDTLESVLATLDAEPNTAHPDVDCSGSVVVTCSMARHRHDAPLWPVDSAGRAAVVTTLGNRIHDGGREVAGSVAGDERSVETVVVVGHTECRVVADAYQRYVGDGPTESPGIESRLGPLVDLVADAVAEGIVDAATPSRTARYRLVEYNVVRQVQSLAEHLPDATAVGYVLDQDGAYSSFPDRHYLVTVDGATGRETVRSRLPTDRSVRVASLLF